MACVCIFRKRNAYGAQRGLLRPSPLWRNIDCVPYKRKIYGWRARISRLVCAEARNSSKPNAVVEAYVKSDPVLSDAQDSQEGIRDKADLDGMSDFATDAVGAAPADDFGRGSALRENLISIAAEIPSVNFRFLFL